MNLRVETSNEQQGDQSVEIVKVYDGDQLIADIKKTGADLAEVKVIEAFKPDLAGAVVYIEEGIAPEDAKEIVKSKSKRLKVGE